NPKIPNRIFSAKLFRLFDLILEEFQASLYLLTTMDEMAHLLKRCTTAPKADEMNAVLSAIHLHLILALKFYCGNVASIDDFAQEAMRRIVERIKSARAATFAEFRSWCITISLRIAADHYRKASIKNTSILAPSEIEKLRETGVEPNVGLSHDA